MPDISTVLTSVGLTLGVQGAYFLAMRFPDQLHRNSATLYKLEIQENDTYLISKISMSESETALDIYFSWRKELQILHAKENPSASDVIFFRDLLPVLSKKLGRLKGMLSTYDSSGMGDVVAEFIGLFEESRRITQSIAFNSSVDLNLALELSDLDVIESKLHAMTDRIGIEASLRDTQYQTDIELLSADINDVSRRYLTASVFVTLLLMVSATLATPFIARLLPGLGSFQAWLPTVIAIVVAVTASIAHARLSKRAYKKVALLRGKTKNRLDHSEKSFKKYIQKLGAIEDAT